MLPDTTIGALLRRAARRDPDRLALVDARRPDRRWTWAELHDAALAAARRLARSHVPGEIVAIWAPSDPAWVVLELAAALAGLAVQPLDPALDPNAAAAALRRTGAATLAVAGNGPLDRSAVITARAGAPALRSVIELGAPLDGPPRSILPTVTRAMPALVLPTSGTTGRPKVAVLSHRAVTTDARLVAARMGLRARDTWLTVMPLHRSGGCGTTVLGCLATGAAMVCSPTADAAVVLDLQRSLGVTVLSAFPRALQDLVDAVGAMPAAARPDQVRLVQTGGAPVSPALVRSVAGAFGARMSVVYGLTEAAPVLTQTDQADRDDDPAASVGRPLPETQLAVVDARQAPLPRRAVGEIVARGPQLMDGYVGDADATAAAIDAGGWLHTGDVGWIDDDGRLHVEGRLEDVIESRAGRWLPGPVERVLAAVPGVAEAVVVGITDPVGDPESIAFIRRGAGADVDEAVLRDTVAESCGIDRVPDRVWFLDEMPALPSGKVRRFVLRELARSAPVAPR